MRVRISEIWSTISSGLWFLPTMMVISSFCLAIITLWLDSRYSFEFQAALGLVYSSSVEGGRELLSTIAGSMMTVTGVVFSITIVTLSLTSNQYGPRLLRNFLRDRGNQIVLGTFLGTFTYTLVILRTLQNSGEEAAVPEISITTGAVLALTSLGVLIYFIHHISQSIQASSILSGVGRELTDTVNGLFPERLGSQEGEQQHAPPTHAVLDPETAQYRVLSEASGYVRLVNPDEIMETAVKHNAIIHLDVQPGTFVNRHGLLARVWAAAEHEESLAEGIRSAIAIGRSRTPFQDIDFLMSQLVQSVLLALSPGVNNSIVAIEAIDWIGASLAHIAEREMPQGQRHDDDGNLRIIAYPPTFGSMLTRSFDAMRESASGNTLVTLHLLHTLDKLLPHTYRTSDWMDVLEQARLLREIGVAGSSSDYDRRRVNEAFQTISEHI